jgi:hypothetical protein
MAYLAVFIHVAFVTETAENRLPFPVINGRKKSHWKMSISKILGNLEKAKIITFGSNNCTDIEK